MQDINLEIEKEALEKLQVISEDLEKEYNKEQLDKEKIMKLRYAQMIQGLYLQNNYFKKY